MLKLICALKLFVTNIVCLFLGLIIPSHIQRSLFITTLYVRLEKDKLLNKTSFEKLNDKLALASVDDSLKFNAEWTDVIWCGVDIKQHLIDTIGPEILDPNYKLSYSELTIACGYLADKCPKCLMYGNRNQIATDIRSLFICQKDLLA